MSERKAGLYNLSPAAVTIVVSILLYVLSVLFLLKGGNLLSLLFGIALIFACSCTVLSALYYSSEKIRGFWNGLNRACLKGCVWGFLFAAVTHALLITVFIIPFGAKELAREGHYEFAGTVFLIFEAPLAAMEYFVRPLERVFPDSSILFCAVSLCCRLFGLGHHRCHFRVCDMAPDVESGTGMVRII